MDDDDDDLDDDGAVGRQQEWTKIKRAHRGVLERELCRISGDTCWKHGEHEKEPPVTAMFI